MTVRMGIPNKGRLNERAVELLIRSGVDLGEDWGRRLHAIAEDQDLEVLFLRAQDIPAFIGAGAIDFGITGEDMAAESGRPLRRVAGLGFGACRLAIAAPEASGIASAQDIPDGARIATSFPKLTGGFIASLGKTADIVGITGAAEIMPHLGVADMISDLVATGSTLRINRLREVCTIMESQAAVFARPTLDAATEARMNEVVDAVLSVIAAEGRKYLMANVPRDKLDDVRGLLPGIGGATVMEVIGDPGMVAVQAVVAAGDIFAAVSGLRRLGATGILTVPMDRLVE